MPRGRQSNKLQDKYLQFFQFSETSSTSTSLQTFDYDTGMNARGGWIWEIHMVEIWVNPDPGVIASAAVGSQHVALSLLNSLTVLPTVGDYGCVYRRSQYRIGNGTSNLQYFSLPEEVAMYFPKPMLYAKPAIYLYYSQGTGTAIGIYGRIGYLTKAVSGQLLWETVEQYMSGGV